MKEQLKDIIIDVLYDNPSTIGDRELRLMNDIATRIAEALVLDEEKICKILQDESVFIGNTIDIKHRSLAKAISSNKSEIIKIRREVWSVQNVN